MINVKTIEDFRGEYAFLSNFHPTKVTIDKLTYDNAEAALQAQRAGSDDQRKLFTHVLPSEAQRLGRRLTPRADWDQVKDEIMRKVLQAKFADSDLKTKLLATGDAKLICHDDEYWGVRNGKGENKLGRMLEDIRTELKGATSASPSENAESAPDVNTATDNTASEENTPEDASDDAEAQINTDAPEEGKGKKKKKHH